MRSQATVTAAFFLILMAACIPAPAADAPVAGQADFEYSLTLASGMPSPGQEVVVALVGGSGQPGVGPVRWSLSGSGAPFRGAGVRDQSGLEYAFTPTGPGSYTVQAEFRDPRGTYIASSLQIVISSPAVSQGVTPPAGAPPMLQPQTAIPLATMPEVQPDTIGASLTMNSPQARVGQPVTFAFDSGGEVPPAGSLVDWEVFGSPATDIVASGRYKGVLTLVPAVQGTFLVKAEMRCPLGNLLGRVTRRVVVVP